MDVLICRDCDTVYSASVLRRGEVAACRRCGAILGRGVHVSTQAALALVIAAAILFAIANSTPILGIEIAGTRTEANVWHAVFSLEDGWIGIAAVGLAITTFLVPAAQIAMMLWILTFVCVGLRPPGFRPAMVLLHWLRPWSMTEIFLLGALVAIVKLGSWVPITAGVGIWALAALTAILAVLGRCDPTSWWVLTPETGSWTR
jgi:paraquat-inducible protein A